MSGISSASLVDLKAELFRKQEEFKRQKLLNASTNYIRGRTTEKTEKKTTIFSRKNAGVAVRAEKDLVAKTEEEDLHEKSRKTLEAKTKLYEKITRDSGIPDEDGSQRFLVDFQKKAIDKQQEQKSKAQQEEEVEENDFIQDEFVDSPKNPDEKWVEYTDSLGRTRTCMKKDLEGMQRKDQSLGMLPVSQNKEREETQEESSSVGSNSKGPAVLTSQEIYCQMLKEKWNKEEEEAQAKPAGPVHYENVRFDEIRTHGVGYFQFSKDETARQEQMDLLNSIRDQTKDERKKRNELKEKRDNLKAARLKKIKDRQRAKLGLPPEPEKEEEEEPSPDPKIPENIPREVKPEVVAKSPAPVREWDLGKDKLWETEKKYFKERREERESEFAPPSSYYSSDDASAPKRRVYQERQYSPPPVKKLIPQKLKKDKIKQQKNETAKEKKMRNCQVVPEIEPDLATIPLPGEAIPSEDMRNYEKLTGNNNHSYVAEYQQPQPVYQEPVYQEPVYQQPAYQEPVYQQPAYQEPVYQQPVYQQPVYQQPQPDMASAASSANIAPSQMWGQTADMTNPQNNAMYVAAYSNQQQSIHPNNVAPTTAYQYTQVPLTGNVLPQQQYTQIPSTGNVIPPQQYTQVPSTGNVIPQETVEPEKPKPMLDTRNVKNVEFLGDL